MGLVPSLPLQFSIRARARIFSSHVKYVLKQISKYVNMIFISHCYDTEADCDGDKWTPVTKKGLLLPIYEEEQLYDPWCRHKHSFEAILTVSFLSSDVVRVAKA